MVNRGFVQLQLHHFVEESVMDAEKALKNYLSAIENQNDHFFNKGYTTKSSGFKGKFRQEFTARLYDEKEMMFSLHSSNEAKMSQLIRYFQQQLSDTVNQEYQYETELVPIETSR